MYKKIALAALAITLLAPAAFATTDVDRIGIDNNAIRSDGQANALIVPSLFGNMIGQRTVSNYLFDGQKHQSDSTGGFIRTGEISKVLKSSTKVFNGNSNTNGDTFVE